MIKTTTVSDKASEASYRVAELVAKSHSVAEALLWPAWDTPLVSGREAGREISKTVTFFQDLLADKELAWRALRRICWPSLEKTAGEEMPQVTDWGGVSTDGAAEENSRRKTMMSCFLNGEALTPLVM